MVVAVAQNSLGEVVVLLPLVVVVMLILLLLTLLSGVTIKSSHMISPILRRCNHVCNT